MIILRKYGVASHIYVPIVKRSVVDFAVGADWTPVAGDCKISKDGGAAANVTNLPTAIAMGNTAYWDFSLTATEMQAAKIVVMVGDAATKAVEDQTILIDTYGNASAEHAVDFDDPVRAGLTALPNANAEAAGGLYTRGSGAGQINQNANGQVDSRTVAMAADVVTASAIATDAIGAAELAADAVAEIQSGLSTLTQANIRTAVGLAAANLDTQLTAIDDFIDTEVAAIKAKTDNLPASPAATGDAMTLTVGERAAVADKLLGRTRAGGADGGRTVAECLAFGRNKWAISGGTLTVYADDDTTPLYTAAVATAPGDPVTSVDPV